jgi:hypothetical protein
MELEQTRLTTPVLCCAAINNNQQKQTSKFPNLLAAMASLSVLGLVLFHPHCRTVKA